MSDDGADLCECLCSHELAMRRLLSLLRQSQAYCTDNECFQELPGGPPTNSNSFMMMLVLWIAVAVILFTLRPNSLRSQVEKPKNNDSGPTGSPPTPPPTTN
ncbi:small integral membrane protein 14 [Schistocerca nitens]|uniref:small integral membrane protein 14 n=1 Tax=Schistocerca cancellata TaxID=274614 RepID=UPI002117925F|nr:small integral membrane protein 14 [Schistocerca cancellata]XP_049762930.1 small integral membrane protein 14 [Schistocerca cancellata]XP_049804287.1 small integral membrane protein 14 [Schistocerca nitens]XP_049804288.1 small integral membrane protein 14 [Schistocerca nitens]